MPKDAEQARAFANAHNAKLLKRIAARARAEDAVLGPGLQRYQARGEPTLTNLTGPLIDAFDETRDRIRRSKAAIYTDPGQLERSVTNSLRRSAGTNYQGLVGYAVASVLIGTNSAWFIQHPVPKELREALAITFTANVPEDLVEGDEAEEFAEAEAAGEARTDGEENTGSQTGTFRVVPDIDVLLRNAAWDDAERREPVVLLSVKTSLADRAGMAARWKTYFDLATAPCPHMDEHADCAYRKLGIAMPGAEKFEIAHALVTANIYKYWFRDTRHRKGELASGQTKSNTYMFDLKFTTRDDKEAETPSDWRQFPEVLEVLRGISERYGLPP